MINLYCMSKKEQPSQMGSGQGGVKDKRLSRLFGQPNSSHAPATLSDRRSSPLSPCPAHVVDAPEGLLSSQPRRNPPNYPLLPYPVGRHGLPQAAAAALSIEGGNASTFFPQGV